MFCSRCGTQVNSEYKYCPSCGTLLSLSNQKTTSQKKSMPFWFKLLVFLAVLALIAVTAGILFTEQWVDVIGNQLKALRENDISKAYYAYTSKEFQKETSLAEFEDFLQKHPIFLNSQSAHFTQRSIKNHIGILKGHLTSPDHKQISVEYRLVQEKGKWKIFALHLFTPEPPPVLSEKEGETEQLIETIKEQLQKIQANQWKEAYQEHSTTFKKVTTEKAFENFIEHHPILIHYHAVSFHKPLVKNGLGSLSVILQSDQTAAYLKYYLVFEEGKWKIASMRILSPSEEKQETEKASSSSLSLPEQGQSIRFGAIRLGDQLNEAGEIKDSKHLFPSSLKDLYVEIQVDGGKKGEIVYLNLQHTETGSSIPAKTTIEKEGETIFLSVFSPPKAGWLKGKYQLIISTSSGLNRTLDFEIQ